LTLYHVERSVTTMGMFKIYKLVIKALAFLI
jgi:hypothetical protein